MKNTTTTTTTTKKAVSLSTLTKKAVMMVAHELYRDYKSGKNDLSTMGLCLKCAWTMNRTETAKTTGNAVYDKLSALYPVAVAFLVRGGFKNVRFQWFDETMKDGRCDKWMKSRDGRETIIATAYLMLASGELKKYNNNFAVAVCKGAERAYIQEFDIHRLSRDIIGTSGVVETKRLYISSPCTPFTTLTKTDGNGETYNPVDNVASTDTEIPDFIETETLKSLCRDERDIEIVDMLLQDVPQKKIAIDLQISAVAVNKRVKRLLQAYRETMVK